MEKFADKTSRDFTAEIASPAGQPGGGSALGLVGACAAALGQMEGNLTLGKEKYKEHEPAVHRCIAALETLRTYMLHLIDEDIKAFGPLSKYAPMDKSDPQIRAHYQASLRLACAIPNEIMYKAAEMAKYVGELAEIGCVGAVSDAGVALCLCRAVMEGARLTCLANIKYFDDEMYAMTMCREMEIVFEETMPQIERAVALVEERLRRK